MCLAGGFKWRGFSERLGDRICFGTISPSLDGGRHRLWLEDRPSAIPLTATEGVWRQLVLGRWRWSFSPCQFQNCEAERFSSAVSLPPVNEWRVGLGGAAGGLLLSALAANVQPGLEGSFSSSTTHRHQAGPVPRVRTQLRGRISLFGIPEDFGQRAARFWAGN
jgi:hypothetical protein